MYGRNFAVENIVKKIYVSADVGRQSAVFVALLNVGMYAGVCVCTCMNKQCCQCTCLYV